MARESASRGEATERSEGEAPRRTSRSLVEDFRTGDPSTVRDVQERVERIIAFSSFRIPTEDRKELCQETLVQIWQGVNKGGFDHDRGFWGFVQTITARRCIDWLRAQRPPTSELEQTVDGRRGPLARLLDLEEQGTLDSTLGKLPLGCRELIELRIGREMSYADISRRLGRSEQALRAQMYRCIARARGLFLEDKDT